MSSPTMSQQHSTTFHLLAPLSSALDDQFEDSADRSRSHPRPARRARNDVVTSEYTNHLHKSVHDLAFKRSEWIVSTHISYPAPPSHLAESLTHLEGG